MFRLLSGLLFAALMALVTLTAITPGAVAQQGTATVWIRTTTLDGYAITDACYTILGASIEGCDENRDGYIRFEGIAPGDYTVSQTTGVAGYLPVGDFPITVAPYTPEQYVSALMAPSIVPAGTTVDIAIRAADPLSGATTPGGCMILHGGSIEGCDGNGDAQITFADVPVGTYLLEETITPDGAFPLGAQWIAVQADGLMAPSIVPAGTTVDIAIRAADPLSGATTQGGCMILHGGSIQGCDENGDAQITFADVPVGTYLLEETVTPDGAFPLGAQWIAVQADGLITVLRPQTGANQSGGTADVALVTRDPRSGDLLPGACYIIENASIEGCDENGDGQVDFADVQVGVFTVHQTKAPAGYAPVNDFRINIVPLDPDQSLVVKQAPEQVDASHRHVSVVFYDTDNAQSVSGVCLEVVGASQEGCDENGDAQIDFLDVPVGSYPIAFTQLPAGYRPAYPSYTLFNSPDNPFSITVVYIGLTPVR